MNLVKVDNIFKSYSEKKLLEDISLNINDGDKIGLIGINGTGKSTLLKIIVGKEYVDKGIINYKSSIRIEHLSQNPEFDFEATILEQVFKGDSPEMKILREYESTLKEITEGNVSLNNKLLDIQGKMDSMDLWNLESEAKTILTKLDIINFNDKIGLLSGGQRKRIALASSLITPCDLLVLDEPTNHMDSKSIAWLEGYLNKRKGALLMITHDRYFLDIVTNKILELYNGKLYKYDGNYSTFVEKKIEREELEVAIQNKKQNLYRKELAWIRRGAKARSTKQKARIDRFENLKNQMVKVKDENLEISVQGSRLGKKIIEIDNISKSFDDKVCIKDFSYIFLKNDRIGIVGPNGAGKTTLMKIISSELEVDDGDVDIGDTVKIGYFSQENFKLDDNIKVIDYIKEIGEYLPLSNGERITASQMLEKFLFPPEMQYNYIGKLSGGEKRRLFLLSILMGAPNVLLLDEPTNDLDIATLTILEDFIENFNGPVITISHDRYFLDKTCNTIFSYKGNGLIKKYNGNYSDYLKEFDREKVIIEANKKDKNNVKNKKSEISIKEKPLKFSFKEQKEIEEIDGIIEDLENQKKLVDKDMEQFSSDFVKIQDLFSRKQELETLLEEKYERWEYLNDLAEKIDKSKEKK